MRKNLSHSEDKNLLYLLTCKLKALYGIKINTKKIPEELSALLKKNPDKKFTISILDGKFVDDFIRVITNFSQNVINKNAFKVIIKK